jgi:microcystin-dependent protein
LSEAYIGEIRMFGGNFAPTGWDFCNGQLLSITTNTALFTLLGTTYGGDGQNTFALPDLRGRVPIHQGQGPGTSRYALGQIGGVESTTLSVNQLPAHTHTVNASSSIGTQASPSGNLHAGVSGAAAEKVYSANSPNVSMSTSSIGIAGGSQPVNIVQPYQTISFIIALFGIFPTSN